jgi:hypothetical protein
MYDILLMMCSYSAAGRSGVKDATRRCLSLSRLQAPGGIASLVCGPFGGAVRLLVPAVTRLAHLRPTTAVDQGWPRRNTIRDMRILTAGASTGRIR